MCFPCAGSYTASVCFVLASSHVIRQSVRSVIYQITVDNFDALFNYTPVDRTSETMMALA